MSRRLFFAALVLALWLAYSAHGAAEERIPRIPVEQVSNVDLVVDLRVAHELGIKVPPEVMYRADEVLR